MPSDAMIAAETPLDDLVSEALKKMASGEWRLILEHPNPAEGSSVRSPQVAQEIARRAALAQGVGVAVRELEWEYHERQMYTYVASDDRGMMYHINQAFGSDSYYFATVRFDGKILYDGDDLPSAQAAAQADFNRRIRAQIAALSREGGE